MASYSRLAKLGAVWSVTREMGNEILSIAAAMVVARLLTPHEFGIAAAASFFTQMAARLTKLGLNFALVQQKEIRRDHESTVCGVSVIIGIAVWLFFLFSAKYLGQVFRSPEAGEVLPVAALTFVIVAFNTVPSAILYRNLMFRQSTLVDWLHTASSSVSMVALAWLGFGVWSIIYSQLIGSVVMTVADIYATRWRVSVRITRRALDDLLSFGAGVYAKRLLDYSALNLDNLVVGRVLGVTALGFYDKAFGMMSRIVDRASLGAGSVFRIFALLQDEPERFRRGYRRTIMTVTLVGYPALAAAAVMGPELFLIMFGAQWAASVPVFQMLSLAGALKLVNVYNSFAVQALGKVWSEVWRQIVYVALIIMLVAGFARWGLAAAAFGVVIASAIMTVLMFGLVRRLTGLSVGELLSPHAAGLTCAAGMLGILLLVRAGLLSADVRAVWLLFGVQASVAALWFAIFVFKSPFGEVAELVAETIEQLRPRLARAPRDSQVTT